MIAYHINNTTADKCEMNIGQARANELQAQGWLIVEEPIVWKYKEYVNGEVVDKYVPPAPEPEPYVPPVPYVPSPEEVKQSLINAVQAHLDSVAKAKGYDNILSAVTYAGDAIVPQFSLEGQAYKTWRTQVWAFCYAYLAGVQVGTKAVPTASQLIALLPPPPAPIEYVIYGNNA